MNMKTKQEVHEKYLRIAEIMVTCEYNGELEKIGAVKAVCDQVYRIVEE